MYLHDFTCWADVQREFRIGLAEPSKVYVASYGNDGDYYGFALVVFRDGESYVFVDGSHCSCHGLDECWKPEIYDKEEIVEILTRMYDRNGSAAIARAAIEAE